MNHTEHEMARLVDEWIAAEVHADTAFLERLLTDEFMAVGPLGFLLTRREWIERHRSGNLTYSALSMDEVSIRLYNNTAIAIGRQVQKASYLGNNIEAQLRTTAILVNRDGQWQLASVHMSAIGQPPSFAQQRGQQ